MDKIKRNVNRLKIIKRRKLSDIANVAEISGGKIYITSKTPSHSIEHEKGHYALGHDISGYPTQARTYIKEEIEANLYAYKRTGQPKGLYQRLLGIFVEVRDNYNVKPEYILDYMKEYLKKYDVPDQWKKDYLKVVIAYRKTKKKR